MSACPYCHAAIKYVILESDPRIRLPVDPLPISTPGPGDVLIAGKVIAPKGKGMSPTRVGYRMARGEHLRPGYLRYVDHTALCEQIAPDHPRRPPRTEPTLLEM